MVSRAIDLRVDHLLSLRLSEKATDKVHRPCGVPIPDVATGMLRQVRRLISSGYIGSYSGHGAPRGRWRPKSGPDLRAPKPLISKLGKISQTFVLSM